MLSRNNDHPVVRGDPQHRFFGRLGFGLFAESIEFAEEFELFKRFFGRFGKEKVEGDFCVFEPTGGIDAQSVRPVVETCLAAGAEIIIPHIYTAFVDKETGATDPAGVAKTTEELLALVNG